MSRITSLLAFSWVLSLPFYQFSLVGSLSLDNLMAPILLAFILLRNAIDNIKLTTYQINNLFKVCLIAIIYFLTHTIGLIFTQGAVWSSAYAVATNMLYFILPVMFVRTVEDLRKCNDAMILGFFIASISALLAAVGLFEFEFSRQAESRIGVEALQKSIGVISSYGDVGIMFSLSLLLVISARKEFILFGHGSRYKILLVFVIGLIGVASMQSRNILLTLITSMFAYWLLGRWMNSQAGNWSKKLYIGVFSAIIIVVLIIVSFGGPLLEFIQSVGGTKEAAGTVSDRLSQYNYMLGLLDNQFLLGVNPDIYEKYEHEISLIHNLWLKELVQGGVLSAFAMFILWWSALVIQVNNYRRGVIQNEARVYLSVLLGMLVATQFYPAGALIFWAIIGLCSVIPAGMKAEGRNKTIQKTYDSGQRILSLRRVTSKE